MTLPQHVRVAIVGSGFAGLGAAIGLKRSGRHDFVILERGDDVGGTWRDNTSPGVACDVPSQVYSFSFAKNPRWSRAFSPGAEIQEYLRSTADAYGLREHLHTRTELLSSTWVPQEQHWVVETSGGTLTADVLIAATGPLSEPSLPDIPGLDSFAGKAFHSARWDHDWSAKGRRVAVIGTGASAIQFVPHVQKDAEQVVLFQRTAPWVLPRADRAVSSLEQRLYARFPAWQTVVRGGIYLGRESHILGFRFSPRLMRMAQKLAVKNLEQVSDPVKRAKLTPTFTLGCKRVLLSNAYYRALDAANADIVTDRIVEVVPQGVVTEAADGTRTTHEVDTIVYGTGFSVTDPPVAARVHAFGQSLREHWAGTGMQALHGLTVNGFPNLFFLVGPNTGLGHNSIVLMIEAQVGHLIKALDAMDKGDYATIEPRADVQAAYNARLQRQLAKTVWNRGGCSSWYLDSHGRNTTLWPTFTFTFKRELASFTLSQYVVQPRQPATARTAA
jgi:cation diffusion facilitator CzcD-associated flavoprotein CzcO